MIPQTKTPHLRLFPAPPISAAHSSGRMLPPPPSRCNSIGYSNCFEPTTLVVGESRRLKPFVQYRLFAIPDISGLVKAVLCFARKLKL